MKVVILAGGLGTRLSEETQVKPKPMVEIGEYPILWHIMKTYDHFGFRDFLVCLGYKGYQVKEYFHNYFLHNSDVTIDIRNRTMDVHQNGTENWRVTLVDTGFNTMTGGRVKRVEPYLKNEAFMLTYGDGVGDVNIPRLLEFHRSHGKTATLTAVRPTGRFGALEIGDDQSIRAFQEKPDGDGTWVNGGFFVFNSGIFRYLNGDETILERDPMENLVRDGQLKAYRHEGFWQPMDTLRDKIRLEQLWQTGKAPWKIW